MAGRRHGGMSSDNIAQVEETEKAKKDLEASMSGMSVPLVGV